MLNSKIKKLVFFIKIFANLVLLRPFGKVIYDYTQKYADKFSISDFRKLEKLYVKQARLSLDVNFLINCRNFNVFPKFTTFKIPNSSTLDTKFIKRRLLKSALKRRNDEKRKCDATIKVVVEEFRQHLSGIDWFILMKSIRQNVKKETQKIIRTHQKKLQNLTKNSVLPFNAGDTITNLSRHSLSNVETELLKYGLHHSLPPKMLNKTEVLVSYDLLHRFMKEDLKHQQDSGKLQSEISHIANSYYYNYLPSKSTLKKHGILKRLQTNPNIVITRPDKGNGVVVLDKDLYEKCIHELISDKTKFKKLDHDVTLKREKKLQNFLRKLKNDEFFDKDTYLQIYPSGSKPARIYGLPKMHKTFSSPGVPKFRPIVSSINTYNYKLAKYLCKLLNPCIPNEYCSLDSFSFTQELSQVSLKNKFLISYDVVSLFTNIPLKETINLAVETIFTNKPDIKISKNDLAKLFHFATAETHFLFKGNFYDQIDGVAMGSPLAPVLANLFMGYHEANWINNYSHHKPLFYRRYVDDIFSVFNNENEAIDFFNYLNKQHPNIKFTYEKQIDNKIAFLDIFLDNSNSLITSVYHKKTYTGLLTNYLSFTSFSYKTGLIKCLLDRAFKINNSWLGFHNDKEKIFETLMKNMFPRDLLDKICKNYLEQKYKNNSNENDVVTEGRKVRYFKLPYIGKFSESVQKRINFLCKKYCKDSKIKIVFTSSKIKNYFSMKDKIPESLNSYVVYEFKCAGCNSCYIGETHRHLPIRIDEHLRTDKKSHIYQHIREKVECFDKVTPDCFSILDTASTKFQLKLKEGLYIGWKKPDLNKQVKYVSFSLTV